MPNEDDKREPGQDEFEREADRGVRQRLEGLIPDLVKKTFYAGLGAVFTTEEGIRRMASEFSLPKDVATYLISSAQSTKDEVFRIFAKEIREFLEKMDLTAEMVKILTSLTFEIRTEIRFVPSAESISGVKRDVKRKVAIKRIKEDGSTEEIEEPKA